MAPRSSPPARAAARLLAALAVVAALAAGALLLWPDPLADVFFAGWVLVAIGLAVAGAAGAWTDRTPVAWLAALLLAGLAVVGMWSIGVAIAPAGLLLLAAAGASQVDRRRLGELGEASPSRDRDALRRSLAGLAALVAGAWLVDAGAVSRPLFARGCARETAACLVAVARWDGVAVTLLGLAALGLGGWLLWTGAVGPVRTPGRAD